jgi:hypothetical protein
MTLEAAAPTNVASPEMARDSRAGTASWLIERGALPGALLHFHIPSLLPHS